MEEEDESKDLDLPTVNTPSISWYILPVQLFIRTTTPFFINPADVLFLNSCSEEPSRHFPSISCWNELTTCHFFSLYNTSFKAVQGYKHAIFSMFCVDKPFVHSCSEEITRLMYILHTQLFLKRIISTFSSII